MSKQNLLDGDLGNTKSESGPDACTAAFPLGALAVLRLTEIEQCAYDWEGSLCESTEKGPETEDQKDTIQTQSPGQRFLLGFGSPEHRAELRALLVAAHAGCDTRTVSGILSPPRSADLEKEKNSLQ
jgi:hypothetical protein